MTTKQPNAKPKSFKEANFGRRLEDRRGYSPDQRAKALIEALPYLQQFRGAVIVIKFGGHAMVDDALVAAFAQDIALLHSVGIKTVVVHGGAPQIKAQLAKLGIESEFKDSLRVTDTETLEVARMVLVGKVGRDIVGVINTHGPFAVGLSGEDGGLIRTSALDPDLGFVGKIESVNPDIIQRLLDDGFVPIVSSIGSDEHGQAYNINADTVAGALGGALGADKVIYLTDVAGLLRDVADPTSVITGVSVGELKELMADGTVAGGMIPKVQSCIDAVESGAKSATMLDGRRRHALLLELFTDAGIGTMIVAEDLAAAQEQEAEST